VEGKGGEEERERNWRYRGKGVGVEGGRRRQRRRQVDVISLGVRSCLREEIFGKRSAFVDGKGTRFEISSHRVHRYALVFLSSPPLKPKFKF
jgi:hypothetical protein